LLPVDELPEVPGGEYPYVSVAFCGVVVEMRCPFWKTAIVPDDVVSNVYDPLFGPALVDPLLPVEPDVLVEPFVPIEPLVPVEALLLPALGGEDTSMGMSALASVGIDDIEALDTVVVILFVAVLPLPVS
jgi:hypothetical protein